MDSQTKNPSLRWQASWVVACRIIGIGATFAGNILAARLLGPAEFGLYLFLSSVAAWGSLVGSAGLSDAALRFSSENLALGHRGLAVAYVLRIARLCTVSTLIAAGVTTAGLLALHLATGRLHEPALLIALTVLTLAALAWQKLAGESLRGWHNLKLASLFSGGIAGGPISNLLFLVGLVALMAAHVSLTAAGVISLLAASVCITVPFAMWCVWRMMHGEPSDIPASAAKLSRAEDRQLLSMAFTVLMVHLLTFALQQLDIWIGEVLLVPDELGVYGVAKRCMLLTAMPVQMVMLTIVASIPRLYSQGRRRELQTLLRSSTGIAAIPSLAALGVLVLFPGPALQLLFGGSYAAAAPIIRILAVGHVVLVLVGIPINLLALTGRQNQALVGNLISVLVIATVGPFAAIWFGMTGLAWISTAALILQCASLWWLAHRELGIWTHAGLPRRRQVDESSAGPRVAAPPRTTRPIRKASAAPLPPLATNVMGVLATPQENK